MKEDGDGEFPAVDVPEGCTTLDALEQVTHPSVSHYYKVCCVSTAGNAGHQRRRCSPSSSESRHSPRNSLSCDGHVWEQ